MKTKMVECLKCKQEQQNWFETFENSIWIWSRMALETRQKTNITIK